jgi:hypothetical protein
MKFATSPTNRRRTQDRRVHQQVSQVKVRKTDGHVFELDKTLLWRGRHAFRRGLATTLRQLELLTRKFREEIQGILYGTATSPSRKLATSSAWQKAK